MDLNWFISLGLLTSIVPGLMNDKPETVILVLNTFRLKIVENVKISKTLKIHTFNTPVLRSLAKLYDYKSENDSKVSMIKLSQKKKV